MGSASDDFGKDHGLIHEAVVTGRKAKWGSDEWAKLAHDENLMREIRKVLHNTATIVDNPATNEMLPELLVSDGYYAAVNISERHDPDAFWQSRPGLYVGGDFRSRIVAAAKLTETGAKFKKLPRFKLGRKTTGNELNEARPKGIWTATDFCPWLAEKLTKQANGQNGEFLNNGWANLFLVEGVEVFVVDVCWYDGEWCVDAWRLDREWYDSNQFGSRN